MANDEQRKKKGVWGNATYKDAGVDIDAGNHAVDLIKDAVHNTFQYFPGEVLTKLGGFSGIGRLDDGRIVGAGTDGVGTKLMLAFIMNQHSTVGIDLVAMCVNDLMVANIVPAFFLDYAAMGKQLPERTKQIVLGVTEGCRQAQCALIGGEMAEMPGLYEFDEYDLAGFAVGFANSENDLILGKDIESDMYLYGWPSTGVHSNGYSLIRRLYEITLENKDRSRSKLEAYCNSLKCTLGEELLRPTAIYVEHIKHLVKHHRILGMSHITGGGLVENPIRMLPDGLALEIDFDSWQWPEIFGLIAARGNVTRQEMLKTFNCGIGLVFVSSDNYIPGAMKIGRVISSPKKEVIFK
jgi:phosphoribosylformylglycinamidine cyclo-ligase